jgi:GT2 family glycosyltransferase
LEVRRSLERAPFDLSSSQSDNSASVSPGRNQTTVSVIVCTRDRAESCRSTLAGLLETSPANCELVVVDQTQDGSTLAALVTLAGFESVVYLQSDPRGSSAARNEGSVAAAGELLLYTDDDCVPEPGWVRAWLDCFANEPETGIGFGQVSCPPFDPTKGFTGSFIPRNGSHGVELFRQGAGRVGMGANMAVRRRVWEVLEGFDEGMGPATRFPAAEEVDLAYRACRAGYRIRHLAAARVRHFGYRQGADASRLVRGYAAGIAAMYAKHARCGDLEAIRLLFAETAHHTSNVTRHLLSGSRPLGLAGFVYYLRGVGSSLAAPIDRRRRMYGSPGRARVF